MAVNCQSAEKANIYTKLFGQAPSALAASQSIFNDSIKVSDFNKEVPLGEADSRLRKNYMKDQYVQEQDKQLGHGQKGGRGLNANLSPIKNSKQPFQIRQPTISTSTADYLDNYSCNLKNKDGAKIGQNKKTKDSELYKQQ